MPTRGGCFTPRYGYRQADSNIPLFEYDGHLVSIGLKAITF